MIQIDHISFSYPDKTIFHDFSMEIGQGERICLMGPSGTGKTTLLSLLTGHLQAESGSITCIGTCSISMVFQEDRLCKRASAVQNILLGCCRGMMPQMSFEMRQEENDRFSQIAKRDRVICHLDRVDLAQAADLPAEKLSGGMKRRVCLVRAMLSQSNLVILDEPFTGMDSAHKRQVIDYIDQSLCGRALLMVSHERQDADTLGARIVCLS